VTARQALSNVCVALAYTAVYAWCYAAYLNYNYEDVGFTLYSRSAVFLTATVILTVAPTLAYRGTRAVSSVLAAIIYLLLYVPVQITFGLGSSAPLDSIVLVQLTFAIGMTLVFLADIVLIENPLRLDLGRNLMPPVLGVTVASVVYILVIYHGNLHFASFGADLYEARAENQVLGSGLVTRYVSSWLSTVLVPLCLAYGLTARRRWYVATGAIACLVLYVAASNKISILLPFAYIGFYLFARRRVRTIFPALAFLLAIVIGGLVEASHWGTVMFLASAIVLMRTIGNGGQLTMAYYDFFNAHPHTDYSHVNGINLFTHPYPYGSLGVGEVVGQFYWSPLMNANANFWATDGIAAMGLVGVLIASVVCAALFMALNTVTRGYDTLFVALCFLSFMSGMLNASLFSAIWSGGAFFLMVFFVLDGGRSVHGASDLAPAAA